MPSTLIRAMVEGLRQTVPFGSLPVMNRPLNELWFAHNHAMLQLRLPLYHRRLGKSRPKDKVYDDAIQGGLALLSAFARQMGTKQVIVRISDDRLEAISFQPRPFAANWTREHALSPGTLADPMSDPLTLSDQRPRMQTSDILFIAGKTAEAIAELATNAGDKSGHATFEFDFTGAEPDVRVVYRQQGTRPDRASHTVILRNQ